MKHRGANRRARGNYGNYECQTRNIINEADPNRNAEY